MMLHHADSFTFSFFRARFTGAGWFAAEKKQV